MLTPLFRLFDVIPSSIKKSTKSMQMYLLLLFMAVSGQPDILVAAPSLAAFDIIGLIRGASPYRRIIADFHALLAAAFQ